MGAAKSGYMKNKKQTIKEMDEISAEKPEHKNPIDRVMQKEQDAHDESRGITDTVKNVFDTYWND